MLQSCKLRRAGSEVEKSYSIRDFSFVEMTTKLNFPLYYEKSTQSSGIKKSAFKADFLVFGTCPSSV